MKDRNKSFFRRRRHSEPEKAKKKTIRERMAAMTYMQASLGLFAASLLMLVICLVHSVQSHGNTGFLTAGLACLAFLVACGGLAVTCYGHFVVRMEGKVNWIAGIITNGTLVLIMLILYISGAEG